MSSLKQHIILLLSNTYGGVLAYTQNLIRGLPNDQFSLIPYFISRSIEFHTSDLDQKINFLTIKKIIPNPVTLFRFFSSRVCLIHSNFVGVGLLAVFSNFLFKIPFLLTLHGFPEPRSTSSLFYKIKYSLEKKLMNFVCTRASAIVVVSRFEKELLLSNFGLNSEVIYHGIDLSTIQIFDKKQAKKEIGCKETDFVVLFVGKLIPNKDPLTLVESIKNIASSREDFKLIIVGTGELEEKIRRKVEKMNIEYNVKFFGYITKNYLNKCYSAADLFILPSINEPFGIVLLEAMAFGCPIIASNSGACPEVIDDCGLLFKQGDYKDLEQKILKVINNTKLRQQLSDQGLKRLQKNFSNNEHIRKHIELYRNILKIKD
jgi:glycosyltransferase involved in cell wall biosynthesis